MRRILVSTLIMLGLASCGPKNGIEPDTPDGKAELEVNTASLDFTEEAGSGTIELTTNTKWTASTVNDRASDWLSINPAGGEAGTHTINVSAAANDTPDDRSASVVIKAGDVEKVVKVNQKQKDALTVTSSKFELDWTGGDIRIEVKSNIDFQYTIDGPAQEWIEPAATKAMKTSVLTFTVKENGSVAKRNGTITVFNGELKEVIEVYQAGMEPSIIASQNEISVSADETQVSIEVKSNVDVTVEMPEGVDWITEVVTKSLSTNTYTFNVAANEGYDNRSAKIKFTNAKNGLSETVAIIQKQKDALTVTSYRFDVPYDGSNITIEVKANVDFSHKVEESAQSWIAYAETKGLQTSQLVFNVMPNTTEEQREGKIIISSGDLSETITVYQSGPEPSIILTHKDQVISSFGQTINVEVVSNVEVEMVIPEYLDWITDVTTKSMEATTFTLEVAPNESYDSRSAKVAFVNREAEVSDTLYISQMQKDAIVLARTEYEFEEEGGDLALEVLTNVEELIVDIDPQYGSWISYIETKSLTNKTLQFKIAPFDEPNQIREGAIIIRSKYGTSQYILIRQSSFEEIDGDDVPDDEIWYRTDTHNKFNITAELPFDREIISHTYENGKGVIKFDGPVTLINQFVFQAAGDAVTEIYLPDSIEHIGAGAFSGSKLQTFRVPENLKRIDDFGVSAPTLTGFTGHHVSEDGRCIIIDNTLYAFAPAGIKEYTFSGMEIIFSHAIRECEDLEIIRFDEGIQEIAFHNMYRCPKLKKAYFPQSLIRLGDYIFHECPALEGFYGNENFHTADNRCLIAHQTPVLRPVEWHGPWVIRFAGGDLTEYTIPDGVKVIDNYAFDGCENLKKLYLNDDLVFTGASAIVNCPNLEGIYGKNASADNRGIQIGNEFVRLLVHEGYPTTYHIPDDVTSVGIWAFSDIPTLEHITMGDQIINIGGYAFSNCPNLKSVTLSGNLQRIGNDAYPGYNPFLNSTSLEAVYFRSYVPPAYVDPQMTEFTNLTMYIPSQSASLYNRDIGWSSFRKYMKEYDCQDMPMPDYYVSKDFSKNGEVVQLQKATEGNGIDLVLMGDIYSDRQIESGLYRQDMELGMEAFFAQEPFKSFRHLFNVYMVTAVSAVENMYIGATAFNTHYPPHNSSGIYGYEPLVLEYLEKAVGKDKVDEAMAVVLMNDPYFGGICAMFDSEKENDWGSGTSISYFPVAGRGDALITLIQHETGGHGFAKLADEYVHPLNINNYIDAEDKLYHQAKAKSGWYKNVDFTDDPGTIKWSHILSDPRYDGEDMGIYEGGATYGYGVWRPSESSLMNDNRNGFNAVSREAIYYRIHKLAYGDSWVYDYEEFVKYDEINRKASAAQSSESKTAVKARTHAAAPIIMKKTWKEVIEEGRNGTYVMGR